MCAAQVFEINYGQDVRIDIANAQSNATFRICPRSSQQASSAPEIKHSHALAKNAAYAAAGEFQSFPTLHEHQYSKSCPRVFITKGILVG